MSSEILSCHNSIIVSPEVLSCHHSYCRVTRGIVMVVASVAVGEGLCGGGGVGGGG